MLMYLFTCVLSGLITTYLLRVINYSKNSYIRFIQHFVIYFVLFIIFNIFLTNLLYLLLLKNFKILFKLIIILIKK